MSFVFDFTKGAQEFITNSPAETIATLKSIHRNLPYQKEQGALLYAQDLFIRDAPRQEEIFISAAGLAFWLLRNCSPDASGIMTQSRTVTFAEEIERVIRDDRRRSLDILHLLGTSYVAKHPETLPVSKLISEAFSNYKDTAPYATLAIDAFGIGLYLVDSAGDAYTTLATPLIMPKLCEWLESTTK